MLSFSQDFLLVSHERREQIADDPARPCLDLDRDRHARTEIDEAVLDLHLRAVEGDTRGVAQFLAFRFAAGGLSSSLIICFVVVLRLVDRDGIG